MSDKLMLMDESKYYARVLNVTELVRKKEWKLAGILFAASIIFTTLHYTYFEHRAVFLVAVMFYGLAISLLLKRDMDVKLGGISTFALLLYYTLDNLWIMLHFFIIVALGIPVAIALSRRGYLGPMMFYSLALVMLPISALSYVWFGQHYSYSLVNNTFQAEEVIYIFLPMIYIHASLSVKRSLIVRDALVFYGLMTFSVLVWWIVDSLVLAV